MTFSISSLCRCLDRFCRETYGGSVIELAFVLPIVAFLAVGAFDFGMALMEGNKIEGAARSGAQYARVHQSTEDADGIRAAVWAEAGDATLTVNPTYYCLCADTGATSQPCNANCSSGDPARKYIEVEVIKNMDMTFDYPGLPSSMTLQSSVDMRIN